MNRSEEVLIVEAVEPEKMKKAISEYFEAIGWDENGVPKSEELKRLGLSDVDTRLKSLRN